MTDCSEKWVVQDGDTLISEIESVTSEEYDRDFVTIIDQFCRSGGSRGEEPTHIDTMQEKGLFDYDTTGESGQLRSYPRGKLLRDLLIEFAESLFLDSSSMPVETPTMYEVDGAVEEHAESFEDRQYRFTNEGKNLMLRFASDFGHFSILRDLYFSENDLPLSIHEICRYAFRREQRGEISGLYRLRSFTMPDMHTVAQDENAAISIFSDSLSMIEGVEDATGVHYQAILRLTDEFYNKHEGWVSTLSQNLDRPLLIQKLGDQPSYWSAKIDFAFVDGHDHVTEGPTVQLDLQTAERFDIKYTDGTNEHYPVLLHTSPTGSIERLSAILLESAALDRNPHLPEWLAPTQVRLIPVCDQHLNRCSEIADQLESEKIRVEIDDRDETVKRRVMDAEKDWAAFYSVIGDDEIDSGEVRIHVRSQNVEREVSTEEYVPTIEDILGDYPRKRHHLPRLVSDQVKFVN
ncbi:MULTISPECIES: aminoacyl--tRNA ligase-related protein [unclassified Natrinema]|uniref:aminoacyl--tRNA ligase-related protein n=1 Tax=unclassified Natrinema TaxID=2622230 RepID=UPI00026D501F|nr:MULTISPECIES: aminoacyl--tRNA ligase-related protein [unclassified Natrinema]AFO59477.1 threonyl-tRNA synthetase [Natrinema sp. J7-2]